MKSLNKNGLTIIYVFFVICSVPVLLSTKIPPHKFWIVGVFSYLIPLVIIVHLLFFIYSVFKKKLLIIVVSGIFIVFSYGYIVAILPFQVTSNSDSGKQVSVLSYNASFFHNRGRWQEGYDSFVANHASVAMKDWLVNNNADIKCIQEFYNHDDSEIYNNINAVSKNGEYDYYFSKSRKDRPRVDWNYGLAIFSRYPIVNSGEIFFSNNAFNKGAYSDIKINSDTIRIINVHLQSMGLAQGAKSGFLAKSLNMVRKVKYGLIARSLQVEVLKEFINDSPYKVIVCGDMNELPFSFVYNEFEEKLDNAFEAAGYGFGGTYNMKPLFFLRIDHQFSDQDIAATNFKIYKEVSYSDNFPIEATYTLKSSAY